MKPGDGKKKGGIFEREIAKTLSLWISEGKNPNIFWRSASSGAKATQNRKFGNTDDAQCGDICLVDPAGIFLIKRFFIELKHYKNLHMESMIYGNAISGSILEFWDKAKSESYSYGKTPLLIAKQNHQRILVITDALGWMFLTDLYGMPINATTIHNHNAYIFDFEWLIKNCDPNYLY